MGSFLSKKGNDTSEVDEMHGELGGMNRLVSEYAALLEQVSEDRAQLLLKISELQLKNADLSVAKEIYVPLERELQELRQQVAEFSAAADEARAAKRELEACKRLLAEREDEIERQIKNHEAELIRLRAEHEEQNAALRRQLGTAKATITRLKGKDAGNE